jgi:hypothetical protein
MQRRWGLTIGMSFLAAPALSPGTAASDGASPMALSALVSPRVGSVMGTAGAMSSLMGR